jgi:hypothetical protein
MNTANPKALDRVVKRQPSHPRFARYKMKRGPEDEISAASSHVRCQEFRRRLSSPAFAERK